MKNQKGITLVALVVTIVVLLILAGTSIAMLSGDNGIITNAQKATASNTEGQVVENIKNAYNTVKTMVIVGASTDPSYDAQAQATEEEIASTIATEILGVTKTLSKNAPTANENGYKITYTPTEGDVSGKIVVEFSDSTFVNGVTFAGKEMGEIKATITIEKANATINWENDPYLITNY